MAQLDRIGVPRFAYDTVLTSGDAARALVARLSGIVPVFPLGPERDLTLYEGLEVVLSDAASAVSGFVRGLFDDEIETPADYADMLQGFAARGLPMVCANPRSHRRARRQDRLLRRRHWQLSTRSSADPSPMPASCSYRCHDLALARLAEVKGRPIERAQILAIGDGIRTDINGAAAAGHRQFVRRQRHSSLRAAMVTSETLAPLFPDPRRAPYRGDGPRSPWHSE